MRFTAVLGQQALLLSALASASSIPRSSTGYDTSAFQLYGYGTGIGGLALFSSGGSAYVGDYTKVNDSEAAPVIFSVGTDAWLGSPNTTAFTNSSDVPSWSNETFAVPSSSSSSHVVGFTTSSSNSSVVTDKFKFYGSFVFVTSSSGKMQTLWYATPSDTDGVYALKWNYTSDDSDDKVLLTLKATPPSN